MKAATLRPRICFCFFLEELLECASSFGEDLSFLSFRSVFLASFFLPIPQRSGCVVLVQVGGHLSPQLHLAPPLLGQKIWPATCLRLGRGTWGDKKQMVSTRSDRTLLGAPGLTTRNKKLLGAPGIATSSKDATR